MTHTKGPRRVEQGTTCIWGACDPNDMSTHGMGYPIAACRITPSANWAKGPDHDSGEANAHLMASAPDLLEALEALMPHIPGDACGEYEDARAAIAKAKGV